MVVPVNHFYTLNLIRDVLCDGLWARDVRRSSFQSARILSNKSAKMGFHMINISFYSLGFLLHTLCSQQESGGTLQAENQNLSWVKNPLKQKGKGALRGNAHSCLWTHWATTHQMCLHIPLSPLCSGMEQNSANIFWRLEILPTHKCVVSGFILVQSALQRSSDSSRSDGDQYEAALSSI